VWHRAAESGNLEALEILWSWAKHAKINRDKLKNSFFLVQNDERQAAFHKAAEDNIEILEKQFVWAKETLSESKLVKESIVSGPI